MGDWFRAAATDRGWLSRAVPAAGLGLSDRLGDGVGYDILSHERPGAHRFIEVKTTNGGHASSFIISRTELDCAAENEDAFHLYRVFQFREEPRVYILKGKLAEQLHLEPIDYRASFRRLVG